MWSKYTQATIVIKTIRDRSPSFILDCINCNLYTTRRKPDIARFFNNSKGKIGLHNISNRLHFMNEMNDNWMTRNPTNDAIRTTLKSFLNFDFTD